VYKEHIPVAQLCREVAAVMQEFTREHLLAMQCLLCDPVQACAPVTLRVTCSPLSVMITSQAILISLSQTAVLIEVLMSEFCGADNSIQTFCALLQSLEV